MPEIRAVTLDFWGTLTAASSGNRQQRVTALHICLPDHSNEQINQAYERSWATFMGSSRQGLGLHTGYILAETLRVLGTTLDPFRFGEIRRYWEEIVLDDPPPLNPGLGEMLLALRERDIAIGLISDTGTTPGRVMRQILEREGVLDLFHYLTFSNELGVTKAHPLAYLTTLGHFQVEPAQAIHVGDTPAADLDGAHAAGLFAALLLENNPHPEAADRADIVLECLTDLPDSLLELERHE